MGVLIPRQVVEIKDVTQKIESKARIEAVAQSDNQSQSCVSREQKVWLALVTITQNDTSQIWSET